MVSNILLWNKKIGFIRINEGSGDNLTEEDIKEGYKDYIMLDFIDYDGYDFNEFDGGQIMLNALYQDMFEDEQEVVNYLIGNNEIPNEEYYYLYASDKINCM